MELTYTGVGDYLTTVKRLAEIQMDRVLPQMMKDAGAIERLKAHVQITLVRQVNNCKARVEEIILDEVNVLLGRD